MKKKTTIILCGKFYFWILCVCLLAGQADAQVNVTTHHNDNSRTGLNSQETILNPSNVGQVLFGKLFYWQLDGNVFAQPLYVSNLNLPGQGVHNVVFVATQGDSLFAFDADHKLGTLWSANLIDAAHGGAPGEIWMSPNDIDYPWSSVAQVTLGSQIGITGTPVIDLAAHKIYVVTKSKHSDPNNPGRSLFAQRLHMLDITTGAELGRVDITAAGFDPLEHLNRAALLLSGGTVFVAFGSHNDWPTYHGWLFAYNAGTLAQQGVFNASPGGDQAAIWMSGNGPAADSAGNVYVATANGTFDTTMNGQGFPVFGDYGSSVLKLALSGGSLNVVDYFTTNNQSYLSSQDQDVGSGGVVLLPNQPGANPHLLVQTGKDGTIYVINRDQMTTLNRHYCVNCIMDSQIVQEIPSAVGNNTSPPGQNYYGNPVYWNNNLYFWGINDYLKEYSLNNGLLTTSPIHIAGDLYGSAPNDEAGGHLSVSSNGNQNGIIWSLSSEYYALTGSSVLRAHDASNLNLLYSSDITGGRDDPGGALKFTVPTVANGKVYVGSGAQLTVFGLFGPQLTITPAGNGFGRVTSSPSGIDCGGVCSGQFAGGTSITLTATPLTGSTFAGWSGGGCSGTGTCTFTLSANKTVTATFTHP